MRCPKCGKEVSEKFSYCPYCRANLKADIEAIIRMRKGLLIIAGGVVLIIIGWIGILKWSEYMYVHVIQIGWLMLIIGLCVYFYYRGMAKGIKAIKS